MKKIIHAVEIKAPKSKVFQAIRTQEGLSNWWTTQVSAEEKVGGVVDFTFLEGFNPDMKITKLEGDRSLHWECVSGHDNWQDNTFFFELSNRGDNTLLMFTQNYATELSDEIYGTYNFNWGYYLDSLREYCENGKGKPFAA
jgi:uncharacterized protein YndB with AHSA1/START domain